MQVKQGAPNGIRTRATALKGRRPGPLDDEGRLGQVTRAGACQSGRLGWVSRGGGRRGGAAGHQ